MRSSGRIARLTAVFAVAACAMAVTAASASAVSIEPLSTKFSSNSSIGAGWTSSEASWNCAKATIAGTTNSTKTNYVDVTPTFSECVAHIGTGTYPITYTNNCSKAEGALPWRLTFNEGGKGSVKVNCALEANLSGCVITAPAQTIENGFTWSNEGAKNLHIVFAASFKLNKATFACQAIGLIAVTKALSADFSVAGIQAH